MNLAPRVTSVVLLLTAAFLVAQPGRSQSSDADDEPFEPGISEAVAVDAGRAATIDDSGFSGNPASSLFSWWPDDLVAAPVPGYSPQLGWQLTLVAGYFLDSERQEDVPPSLIAALAMGSENGSRAYGAGGSFHLRGDRLRVRGVVSHVDVRYRFYGVGDAESGRSVEVRQEMPLLMGTALWELVPDFYLGLGLLGSRVETGLGLGLELPAELPDPTFDVDMVAFQVPLEYDTRDDQQFPSDGWWVTARALFYDQSLGSDFDARTLSLAANRYLPIGDRHVLALRAYAKGVGGDAPFFLLSAFGGRSDLRGYESGRYRDALMYAVQAEFRWRPLRRWVFTGFAGAGEVAPDFGDFFDDFLPAAGIGARFVLSPEHNFSVSVDLATGKDGTEIYFGVGEAF